MIPQLDQASCTSSEVFERIRSRSKCPFSKHAKLVHSGQLHRTCSFGRVLKAESPTLATYLDGLHHFDGYVLAFDGNEFASDVQQLKQSFASLMQSLSTLLGGQTLTSEIVCTKGWWLLLRRARHFAIAFADCYPRESPRWAGGNGIAFVVLQPVSSFERFAEDGQCISDTTRRRIRECFTSAMTPYDEELASADLEAPKFLMNIGPGEPPIDWWSEL